MARPTKQGVDYFPHDINTTNRKTMTTLEAMFGNDGYAFWFKLLELLGSKEGLYIDCNDETEWLFLVSKTRVSEVSAAEILSTLARLGAIDRDLWQNRIIWVQNFVDRLSDVYKKRNQKLPAKPIADNIFRSENPGSADISAAISTQSKLNKSKLNKSKALNPSALSDCESPSAGAAENPELPQELCEFGFMLIDGNMFYPTVEYVQTLIEAYPAVDVVLEVKQMAAWCEANKGKRKTRRGAQRFMNGWLERAQNSPRLRANNGRASPAARSNGPKNYDEEF